MKILDCLYYGFVILLLVMVILLFTGYFKIYIPPKIKYVQNGDGIMFSPSVVSFLKDSYNIDNEYFACLTGNVKQIENKTFITIDGYKNIIYGGKNQVNTDTCDGVAVVHSHPSNECSMFINIQDGYVMQKYNKMGVGLFFIQCNKDSIEIHSLEELIQTKVMMI